MGSQLPGGNLIGYVITSAYSTNPLATANHQLPSHQRYLLHHCHPLYSPPPTLTATATATPAATPAARLLLQHVLIPTSRSPLCLRGHNLALLTRNPEKARPGARRPLSGNPPAASKAYRGEIQREAAPEGKGVGLHFYSPPGLLRLTACPGRVSKMWTN